MAVACSWVAAGYKSILREINEEQSKALTDYIQQHWENISKKRKAASPSPLLKKRLRMLV